MVESDWDEEGDCHVTRPQSLNQPNFKQYNNDRHSPKKRQFTERTEYPRRDKISQDSDQITKTIDIDSSYVGRIIGKGGSRINELKFQTNTHISVIDRISENGLSSIVIKGEAKGIEEAVLRIKELTTEKQSYDRPQQFNRSSRNTNIKGTIDWNALHKNTEIRNQERFGNLVEIVKIFYHEPKHINNLTDEEVQKIREDKHKISVKDLSDQEQRNIPRPILSFEDIFEKYAEIMSSVTVAGFKEPSPIQCQAWPIIMSGYDLIGIAQTGTGKTLAFLLPALIHIDSQPTPRKERQGPTCLILSPTRELAQQIHQEVGKFNYKQIRSVCIYGGGSRREQINTVERGVEIVIATPGRLNDLISNNIISLTSVTYLVLDEADRMLDLGFEPEIRKVLLDIRPDRQTIMTSATWPPGVTRLIRSYMTYPMQINVGSLNLTACKNVTQKIEFIEYDDKLDRIKRFIDDMPNDCKVLIFVARKITADHLTSDLVLCNSCDGAIQCIHGNRFFNFIV
uniref:RNA helicase n=1 Tax=Henneguya salminicola TaxID=69463 RepID=A0A6G3ME19_HENSL